MESYSETARDHMELELANRRELIAERRHGLEIIVYWLRQTDTIEMVLCEEGKLDRTFMIPNDSVLDAAEHPEVYANKAGRPRLRHVDEV